LTRGATITAIMIRGAGKVYLEGAKMTENNGGEKESEGGPGGETAGGAAPVSELASPQVAEAEKVEGSLLKVAGERHGTLLELLKRGVEEAGLDADFVHDLRVATRRLGEAAALLNVLMDTPTSRLVDASLKGLRRAAGELRDLDVTSEHLTAGGKWRMPAVVHHVAMELVEEMRGWRGELEKKLREQMASASVTGAMVLLARVIEDSSSAEKIVAAEAKLKKEVEKRMAGREKQLRKRFGAAAKKQTAESLHAARIAAKKLRYVTELADAGGVKRQKKELKFLKGVQELLGDHHDVHVIEEAMQERVKGKGGAVKGLAAAWRKWWRKKEREQGERAAEFFVRSYGWMNAH
jgi:CHAD domain-containing protein